MRCVGENQRALQIFVFYLVSFRKFILEFVVPPGEMIVEVILWKYVDTYIYLVLHLDR